LGYSFSYTVRVPSGVIVIDLGWDSDEAWQVFLAGLSHAGVGLDEIIGVVATHVHPDHYGLAGRIRTSTSAWIAVHEAELIQIALNEPDRDDKVASLIRWLGHCGVSADDQDLLSEVHRLVASMVDVQPDQLLSDGAVVPGTDGALIAIHTPGHSPGHLCFYDHSRGLLFSGDHLLPKTRTHVGKRPGNGADPLGDFVGSLERIANINSSVPLLCLPGHEWSFDRPRDRSDELSRRSARRLNEVEGVVFDGADTVWEVTRRLSWSRPVAEFSGRAKRQVLGETYAHLVRLERIGRLEMRRPDNDKTGPIVWESNASS
jgi:glyoxylase-like metal-dependent hydrolase (beta-lactamase superfamily II)